MRSTIRNGRSSAGIDKKTQSSCLLCFRDLNLISSFREFLHDHDVLCLACRLQFKTEKVHYKIGTINTTSLYRYEDLIQNLLLRYKESGDIALKQVFLHQHRFWFRYRYRHHLGILVPSHQKQIEQRGFNHLPLIYQNTIDLFDGLVKTDNIRQMGKSSKERRQVSFALTKSVPKGYRGYVILDDVITTGSTIKAVESLFQPLKVKICAFSIAFHPFLK